MSDIPFTADELRRMLNEQDAEIARLRATNERLRAALQMLYDEMDEYQRVNNLSAYNNHVMRQARAALAEDKQ